MEDDMESEGLQGHRVRVLGLACRLLVGNRKNAKTIRLRGTSC